MRRILYVNQTAAICGATVSLLSLLDHLDRSRFYPSVLLLEEGPAVSLYRSRGIETYIDPTISIYYHFVHASFPIRSFQPWLQFTKLFELWPSALRARDFLQEHPVDLVHVNTAAQLPMLWGAHLAGIPAVLHVRETLSQGLLGVRRTLFRRAIDRWASRIIAIAQCDGAALKPSPRVRVIYNFVDFAEFDRHIDGLTIRSELGIPAEASVVGMLGGTVSNKGLWPFVQAAHYVHLQRPEVRFVVAGRPPIPEPPISLRRRMRHRLERILGIPNLNVSVLEYLKKHGLQDIVHFVGFRADIATVIAGFDVLAFPATASHFGRPIIEAGAMAKPVVASDFPSTREIVTHGGTGLLVPPNAPQALATAILRILDDPVLARSMGEAGYRQARQKFDAQVNAAATFAVYDEVLA